MSQLYKRDKILKTSKVQNRKEEENEKQKTIDKNCVFRNGISYGSADLSEHGRG